ncbi:unnamed protein product [Amoebophrya sp. A25]|nr:unnamed protein product [Amoebophrya sp. A25]|eukprot:GSA25T00020182001.1
MSTTSDSAIAPATSPTADDDSPAPSAIKEAATDDRDFVTLRHRPLLEQICRKYVGDSEHDLEKMVVEVGTTDRKLRDTADEDDNDDAGPASSADEGAGATTGDQSFASNEADGGPGTSDTETENTAKGASTEGKAPAKRWPPYPEVLAQSSQRIRKNGLPPGASSGMARAEVVKYLPHVRESFLQVVHGESGEGYRGRRTSTLPKGRYWIDGPLGYFEYLYDGRKLCPTVALPAGGDSTTSTIDGAPIVVEQPSALVESPKSLPCIVSGKLLHDDEAHLWHWVQMPQGRTFALDPTEEAQKAMDAEDGVSESAPKLGQHWLVTDAGAEIGGAGNEGSVQASAQENPVKGSAMLELSTSFARETVNDGESSEANASVTATSPAGEKAGDPETKVDADESGHHTNADVVEEASADARAGDENPTKTSRGDAGGEAITAQPAGNMEEHSGEQPVVEKNDGGANGGVQPSKEQPSFAELPEAATADASASASPVTHAKAQPDQPKKGDSATLTTADSNQPKAPAGGVGLAVTESSSPGSYTLARLKGQVEGIVVGEPTPQFPLRAQFFFPRIGVTGWVSLSSAGNSMGKVDEATGGHQTYMRLNQYREKTFRDLILDAGGNVQEDAEKLREQIDHNQKALQAHKRAMTEGNASPGEQGGSSGTAQTAEDGETKAGAPGFAPPSVKKEAEAAKIAEIQMEAQPSPEEQELQRLEDESTHLQKEWDRLHCQRLPQVRYSPAKGTDPLDHFAAVTCASKDFVNALLSKLRITTEIVRKPDDVQPMYATSAQEAVGNGTTGGAFLSTGSDTSEAARKMIPSLGVHFFRDFDLSHRAKMAKGMQNRVVEFLDQFFFFPARSTRKRKFYVDVIGPGRPTNYPVYAQHTLSHPRAWDHSLYKMTKKALQMKEGEEGNLTQKGLRRSLLNLKDAGLLVKPIPPIKSPDDAVDARRLFPRVPPALEKHAIAVVLEADYGRKAATSGGVVENDPGGTFEGADEESRGAGGKNVADSEGADHSFLQPSVETDGASRMIYLGTNADSPLVHATCHAGEPFSCLDELRKYLGLSGSPGGGLTGKAVRTFEATLENWWQDYGKIKIS